MIVSYKSQNFKKPIGHIEWRWANTSVWNQKLNTNFKQIVLLEFIEVNELSKGNGSLLLVDFLNYIKTKHPEVEAFVLTACFDSRYYSSSTNPIIGHKKLISFYEKHGFRVITEIKDYGEGFAIQMALINKN